MPQFIFRLKQGMCPYLMGLFKAKMYLANREADQKTQVCEWNFCPQFSVVEVLINQSLEEETIADDTLTELESFTCLKNTQNHLDPRAAGQIAFQRGHSLTFTKVKVLQWYVLRVFHINLPGGRKEPWVVSAVVQSSDFGEWPEWVINLSCASGVLCVSCVPASLARGHEAAFLFRVPSSISSVCSAAASLFSERDCLSFYIYVVCRSGDDI